MSKVLFNKRISVVTKQFIAILLCVSIILPICNSFFTVSALEEGGDTDSSVDVNQSAEDVIFRKFIELEPTDNDPLLKADELSNATLDILNREIAVINDELEGEPAESPKEEPKNEPPKQDPVYGDGTTIEKITVRWLTSSTGEDSPAGFGRLTLKPDSNNVSNQQFQIDFSLSGQSEYKPGDIEITFPAYLWLDRDGKEPGELTLSVPAEPETGVEFVWKRVGDNIVITNAKTLDAASKVLIQGTFRDVEAWRMVDETLSTESNKYEPYSEFNVTIVVTRSEGTELTMTSNSIEAFIDTSVKVTGATKTAYDSKTKKYNIFWEDVPSELPTDFLNNLEGNAKDYVYIRWYISGTASGSQPFDMTVTDTVEDKYGGIMLGATRTAEGNVISPDGKTVTATLYHGYTESYRTAYIWTAYPKNQFPEGEEVEFNNTQTITVTGWDDEIPSSKSASAKVETWQPIHYKFVKIWDDNDNAAGMRPDELLLNIYDAAYSHSVPSERVYLTEKYADEEDSSHWIYEWTDEGQPGHTYDVEEKLLNWEGDHENRFDDEGHLLHWSYTLKSSSYDPGSHTWEYVNRYDEGWIKYQISRLNKTVEKKYQNNDPNATTDVALNELLRGNSVEVQFEVDASLSAAKPAVGYNAKPNRFVLEDGVYELDNKQYPVEDMNVGAVILQNFNVWEYTDYDNVTGLYKRKAMENQTITLYGYIGNEWKPMATVTDGKIEAVADSGASVTGKRVDLPANTAKVKTEILSGDAAIVDMVYTVCLRLNPTPNMQDAMERYLDRDECVMLPIFNKADGYVVYEGDQTVNVDGDVYRPGEHLVDIYDMDTGYLHGRKYKVAAELNKAFKVTGNDTVNRSIIIQSKITLTQKSNIIDLNEYNRVLESGEIPNSKSGIYYDLLPARVSPDLTTLKATTGGDTVESYYIKENYKGSGRTLLVVKINHTDNIDYTSKNAHPNSQTHPTKGYFNQHTIEFDSYVSWDVVQEYGLDYMRNVAAYEANEEWIGSVTGWEGEPDDPTVSNNILSGNAVGPDSDLMTGLHDNRTDPSFVYAGKALDYDNIDVTATTSLRKKVQVNGEASWSSGQSNSQHVEEGGRYVYQITMKSADDTNTQDIILIDSLENYVPKKDDTADYGDTQWHGSLVSVDVSELEAVNIDPVIYYSTVKNLDVSRDAMDGGRDDQSVLNHLKNDLKENGEHVWSTTPPKNMADVTAIAIDAGKTVDGEDFVLVPGASLTFYLHMKAPFEKDNPSPDYFKGTNGKDHMENAHAYNEIFLDCLQNVEGENTRDYINNNYTKVGIFAKYANVLKVWDDADNADGYRPDSLTVRLFANDKDTGQFVILNEENNWKGEFYRIRTYDDDGNPIVYSFTEDEFTNSDRYKFTPSNSGNIDGHNEIVLTNSLTPEQIEIPVTKTWDDNDNAFFTRPDSVVIRLYADGVFTGKTLTLREDNAGNWSGSFTGLNKYRDGRQEIVYTIEEEYVPDYLSEVNGFTVKNTYHPKGDLIIHKDVEKVTDVSAKIDFTFDLQLTYDDDDESPVLDKFNYSVYDKSGNLIRSDVIGDGDEFTLKGDQYIVIYDLPTHISYAVTEATAKGFTLSSVTDDTGVIKAGDNNVYFTNTYSSSGSFQLDVSKTLTGRDLIRHQFKFELLDENYEVIFDSANDSDGTVSFTQINYTEADHKIEYTYYVREHNGGMPGFHYDGNMYTVKVLVLDDGEGKMNCDVKFYKENGEAVDGIVFNNAYEANGALTLRLWKSIDRNINQDEFTFELYAQTEEGFELKRTASTDITGAVVFDELTFDESDIGNTYMYFAREQEGEDETVKYSNTIIGYAVTVSDNGDGTLSFTSQSYDLTESFKTCETCGGAGECAVCGGFGYQLKTKDYALGDAVTPIIHNGLSDGSLAVIKHVSSTMNVLPDSEFNFKIVLIGDEVKDGKFTYDVIQVEDVNFKEPDKEDEPSKTDNTDNNVISFFKNVWASVQAVVDKAVYFVEEQVALLALNDKVSKSGEWVDGEFSFTLHGGQKAIFSDIPAGTTYQVWEESTSGWMLVSQSNTSGVIQPTVEAQAEFSNRYQPDIATAVLMGVKYLDGKATNVDAAGNIFEFVLLDEEESPLEYVDAQSGGFITFSTLTFEEEGTYKYKIREVIGNNSDIHYDDHEENVTVTVKKDKNGNLVADVKYDKDSVTFENITMPGSLEITKLTEGLSNANKDAEFQFRVKFFNPGGVPINDGSFTWYVKDTDSDEILGSHKADLQTVYAGNAGNKVASINSQSAMPIAGDRELFNSSSTGVIGTVRWSFFKDGTLYFEPVDGEDGYIEFTTPINSESGYPWGSYEYKSIINTIESSGNIHVIGPVNYMFAYEPNLTDASDLASWDMSEATSVYSMFYSCSSLSDVSFISKWNIPNVTTMGYILGGTAVTNADFFAELDISNVQSIFGMFSGCSDLTDISGMSELKLDVTNEIGSLFNGCSNLANISVLANWDVSKVTSMSSIFSGCSSLTDISPLANWNTSNVTSMSNMFDRCASLQNVDALLKWDVSNVENMYKMFNGCSSLSSLLGLSRWRVVSISGADYSGMQNMFSDCTALSNLDDLAGWTFGDSPVNMQYMFRNSGIENVNSLLKWNGVKVGKIDAMFQDCKNLTDITGLANLDVSNCTSFGGTTQYTNEQYGLFMGCSSLQSLAGLEKWNVSNCTTFDFIFKGCSSLQSLAGIERWDVSHATSFKYAFQDSGVTELSAIKDWNVSGWKSLASVFYGAAALQSLEGISGWNVSNVTTLAETFCRCTSLQSLAGLENWDISKVTTLRYTFGYSGVVDLTPIKNWNVSKVGSFTYIFYKCPNLKKLNGLENWVIRSGVNSMFEGTFIEDASAIGSWTLEGISTSQSFGWLFQGDGALTTLDFSNWDGSKISNVDNMWSSGNVSKITFGEKFWNGTVTSKVKVYPATPPTLTTTGYWINENDEFNTNPTTYTSAQLVENKVVGTYIWQYLPPYEISFIENGGSGSMDSIKNYYHLECELPENTFTRLGYVFVGWRDEATKKAYYYDDETNTITIPAKTYKSGDKVKLSAIWEPLDADGRVEYTVQYYQQSATDPEQYVLAETDVEKAEPGDTVHVKLKNYDGFITPVADEWYEIPTNGKLTVQFYYVRVHYTIRFDGNGAEYGGMSDMEMLGGVAAILPELGFGVTAGAFLGWNTAKDGKGDWYYSGQSVKNLAGDGEIFTLYAQWLIIDQSVDATAGEIIVSCKAGQTIVIQGIPAGVTYEIEEINMPSGWYYKDTSNGKGTIPSNSVAYSSVTNEYRATGHASITAYKDLEGATLSSGQFGFTLTESVSEIHKTTGFDDDGNLIETPNYVGGNEVILLPGVTDIHVKMKYLAYYNAPVLAYPKGVYNSEYYWIGSYNGTTETIAQGEAEFDVNDINYPDDCALVLVNVYGYNSAQQRYLASQYYAVLTYDRVIDTAFNGAIDPKEEITDENGNVVINPHYKMAPVLFDTIDYSEPGEYVYYIEEIDGGEESVYYDKHKETVRVIVTDNGDGTLNTEVKYDNRENNEPVFENSMKPGDLVVNKKLTNGTEASKNVKFSFQLFLRDSDGADLTGEYTVNKSDGTTEKVTNGGIVSIKADEYFTVEALPHGCNYQVVELPQDGFTLVNSQGDNGTIIGGETSSATFNNAYSAGNDLVLTATKRFVGGTISAEQFAFELIDQYSQHVETVYADENGKVTFSPIHFTEADVGSRFVYRIFEVSKNDDHIIYDNHTADIIVTVKDNADGTIGFDLDCEEEDLVFTNVAMYDLKVSKTVAGNMGNKAETFTFDMVLSNDDYELGNSVQYRKGEETGTLELDDDHYEFTLAHDESIEFIGLPFGTKYSIVEKGAQSYRTSVTVTPSTVGLQINGKQVSDTLKANTAVSYVNTIDGRVPTNVTVACGWVGIVFIAALAAFIIAKRKRAKN